MPEKTMFSGSAERELEQPAPGWRPIVRVGLGFGLALIGGLVLGGCGLFIGTPAPEGSDALISILVTGDVPDEELSVEIGGAAWAVVDG